MQISLPVAALARTLLAAPAFAQMPPGPSNAGISVTGEASVSVAPDQAVIDGGVTTEAKTAHEAAEANNAAMAKLLAALKSAGLDEKDVQTSRLSVQPKYTSVSSGPTTINGYRASNHVSIKVRDVTKVASVVDALVAAGANEIGGINFVVSQASKMLDDARENAMADARRKAEIYAKAAGVTLGDPMSISEVGSGPIAMGGKMSFAARAAPTPVAQGEETLSVSVNVTWAIKGKGP